MSGVTVSEVPAQAGHLAAVAAGPWQLARRRLLRNRIALVMAGVLVVVVALCLCAPLYAHYIAHTDAFSSNLDGKTVLNGRVVPVMKNETSGLGLGVTPIGPTWDFHHYFLGADQQGRDVAARLLYGGRNSLLIGAAAAAVTCFLGTIFGGVSGFFGGGVGGGVLGAPHILWGVPG